MRHFNASALMHPKNTASARLLWCLLRRLSGIRGSTLSIYAFGLIILQISYMPAIIWSTNHYGWPNGWLIGWVMPQVFSGLAMLLVQQLSVEREGDMVGRPGWFLLMVTLAIFLSYGTTWMLDSVEGWGLYASYQQSPYYPDYFKYVLFFVPVSWLSCLYARRADDEAQFATLSIRRSQLGRELAQSQLLAARSQVDLNLVTRTLRKAYMLYDADAGSGSRLTDQLTAYLRLAMNRTREKKPTLAAELALLRSYISLFDADAKPKIELLENSLDSTLAMQGAISAPVFLTAQKMVEAAAQSDIAFLTLHVETLYGSVAMTCGVGKRPLPDAGLAQVRALLRDMAPGEIEILHHESEAGEHCYVIEFRDRNDGPDGDSR